MPEGETLEHGRIASRIVARRFKTAAKALGVHLLWRPGQHDKAVYRGLDADVEAELLAREPPTLESLPWFQTSFARFVDFYQYERPIGTAGYRTPCKTGQLNAFATSETPETTLNPWPA